MKLLVTASELEDQILDADASGNKSRVDGLLLGAIKNLKSNRAKPDSMMYMNLVYLAKSKPELFISKRVVEVRLRVNKTIERHQRSIEGNGDAVD